MSGGIILLALLALLASMSLVYVSELVLIAKSLFDKIFFILVGFVVGFITIALWVLELKALGWIA